MTTNPEPETRNSELKNRGAIRSFLELARPANVVTAWADILAGIAIVIGLGHDIALEQGNNLFWLGETLSSFGLFPAVGWLILATTGLYAGGVVLNDVFDAELDAVERPERAIPSGRVSRVNAQIFGTMLLLLGVFSAFQVSQISGGIALSVGMLAVLYDRYSKHHTLLGPLNMGLCRAGNLMLGMSILPEFMMWPLAVIPLIYIGAITAVSQGEVHGGEKKTGTLAVGLVLIIVLGLVALMATDLPRLFSGIGFLLLFTWLVLPSFLRAAKKPEAANVRRAVRAGIMGLIPLNAAIAAGAAGWIIGIVILLLLPISIMLARMFAVT